MAPWQNAEKKAFLAGFEAATIYANDDEHEPDPAAAWKFYCDFLREAQAQDAEPCAHSWVPHVTDYEICELCNQDRWLGTVNGKTVR